MSLFDVIRYPISDPPTEAEFLALPPEIFQTFIAYIFIDYKDPSTVWKWVMLGYSEHDKKLLNNLRNAIARYEPI